ncbi:MAG: hypothetical protein R3F19_07210 [Verrucomicrobiales bacterium]
MTNLLDAGLYPAEEFDKVYHLRWNIEESYKSCKCKVEIENWSGKTVASVEQDFHAGVLNLNLVTSIAFYCNRPSMRDAPRLHPRQSSKRHSRRARMVSVAASTITRPTSSGGWW